MSREINKLTLRVMRRARQLIARGWTQGRLAADKNGLAISLRAPAACSFCTHGAIAKASDEIAGDLTCVVSDRAMSLLGHGFEGRDVVAWNDKLQRTKEDVVMAFDFGILMARDEAKAVA